MTLPGPAAHHSPDGILEIARDLVGLRTLVIILPDQHGAASRGSSGAHVSRVIAYKKAFSEIQIPLRGGAQQHAGFGFPALTGILIVMRTNVDVALDRLASKGLPKTRMHFFKDRSSQLPPRDIRLIRDHKY